MVCVLFKTDMRNFLLSMVCDCLLMMLRNTVMTFVFMSGKRFGKFPNQPQLAQITNHMHLVDCPFYDNLPSEMFQNLLQHNSSCSMIFTTQLLPYFALFSFVTLTTCISQRCHCIASFRMISRKT